MASTYRHWQALRPEDNESEDSQPEATESAQSESEQEEDTAQEEPDELEAAGGEFEFPDDDPFLEEDPLEDTGVAPGSPSDYMTAAEMMDTWGQTYRLYSPHEHHSATEWEPEAGDERWSSLTRDNAVCGYTEGWEGVFYLDGVDLSGYLDVDPTETRTTPRTSRVSDLRDVQVYIPFDCSAWPRMIEDFGIHPEISPAQVWLSESVVQSFVDVEEIAQWASEDPNSPFGYREDTLYSHFGEVYTEMDNVLDVYYEFSFE